MAMALAFKAALGIHKHSGQNTPPRFGDFEAQRHWMEITLSLPAREWYRASSNNDLEYWGLDYPPVSAYVSYVFGILLRQYEQPAVELFSSRGYESASLKAFLRTTVLVAEVLVLMPSLLCFLLAYSKHKHKHKRKGVMHFNRGGYYSVECQLAFFMSIPALSLIDHGHFQYNCVSLGLFVACLAAFTCRRQNLAIFFYCISVFFKQMNLYYAPAVAAYLLGTMMRKPVSQMGSFFFGLLATVLLTTLATFWPWLPHGMPDLVHRLFPVSRGLYEDKVANVWCSVSVVFKVTAVFNNSSLFAFCAFATALACLPFCLALIVDPSPRHLLLSSAGCSMAAYLLSYHVHEKQVLIPLIPVSLLAGDLPELSLWMSVVSAFSMYPLLEREGLAVAYIVLLFVHVVLTAMLFPDIFCRLRSKLVAFVLCFITIVLHGVRQLGPAFESKPDLYTVFMTVFACGQFCAIYAILIRNVSKGSKSDKMA